MQYNYINEEGLGVQEVGELVERLGHCGPSSLWDVKLPCDHHVIGTVLRGQEEDAVGVGFVVQEGDSSLAQLVGVVLHLDHQVCEMEKKENSTPFLFDKQRHLCAARLSQSLCCGRQLRESIRGKIISAEKDCFLLLLLQNCFS